jgi:hypothetical protein
VQYVLTCSNLCPLRPDVRDLSLGTALQSFFELLFPGAPLEGRSSLPQNLQELLLWPELVLDLTAVAKAAAKVLAGVRARGAQGGTTSDVRRPTSHVPPATPPRAVASAPSAQRVRIPNSYHPSLHQHTYPRAQET